MQNTNSDTVTSNYISENFDFISAKKILGVGYIKKYPLPKWELVFKIKLPNFEPGEKFTPCWTFQKFEEIEPQVYRVTTIDDSQIEFFLNELDVKLRGKFFNATDWENKLNGYPILKVFADKIISKTLSEHQDVTDKIEEYLFKDSPEYRKDLSYYESEVIYSGLSGLLSRIAELDCAFTSSWDRHLLKSENLKFAKKLNKHKINVISEHKKYASDLIKKSLLPGFFIRTDGFNQCFKGKGGSYYSAVYCYRYYEENKTGIGGREIFSVTLVGEDDSSYTRNFNTFDEAKIFFRKLQYISKIYTHEYMKYLGFKFTN